MKNIKDIVIGIFAVIGFAAILTGFTNNVKEEVAIQNPSILATPESHVWEYAASNKVGPTTAIYVINKQTGEIRYHYPAGLGKRARVEYMVGEERQEKE